MRYLSSITLLLIILFLLVACGNQSDEPISDPESQETGEEEQTLEFVTTPEVGGAPDFLEPTQSSDSETGYPGPDEVIADSGGYPAPQVPPTLERGYPAPENPHSIDGRSQTALTGYELVLPYALDEFDQNAYLSAIAPSHIMLTNLGSPPVLPGWFYKFRKPDSRREYIIQVVDDVVTGSVLTEAVADTTPPEQPLDISQLNFDSDKILAQFEEVGKERGIYSEDLIYDLELVNLAGTNGPTWSVVDVISRMWLYSVDAITGEEVENPYQQ